MLDRKNKEEIVYHLITLATNKETAPEFLENDLIPITLLTDVLIDELDTLSRESVATLVGVVAFLLQKLKIPAARFTDGDGNKLWSLDQVAEFLGTPQESLEEEAKKVAVKPQSIHPLQ